MIMRQKKAHWTDHHINDHNYHGSTLPFSRNEGTCKRNVSLMLLGRARRMETRKGFFSFARVFHKVHSDYWFLWNERLARELQKNINVIIIAGFNLLSLCVQKQSSIIGRYFNVILSGWYTSHQWPRLFLSSLRAMYLLIPPYQHESHCTQHKLLAMMIIYGAEIVYIVS